MPVYEAYIGTFEQHGVENYYIYWKLDKSSGKRSVGSLDGVVNEILYFRQGYGFDQVSITPFSGHDLGHPVSPIRDNELAELRGKFAGKCKKDSIPCTLVPEEAPARSYDADQASMQLRL